MTNYYRFVYLLESRLYNLEIFSGGHLIIRFASIISDTHTTVNSNITRLKKHTA